MDGLGSVDIQGFWNMLRDMPGKLWSAELHLLHCEMGTILLELAEDEPQQSVGALSAADVADDVGLRSNTLAAAASAVASRFEDGHADGEHHDDDGKDPAPISDSTGDGQKKGKYPRVDAPEVEGQAAMAIWEDTPGYIAQAFPKLFPHGTGDFHDSQGGRWGRYVLM